MRLIVTADECRASSLCDMLIFKKMTIIIIILLLTLSSSGLCADCIMPLRLHMACQQRCQSCGHCMAQNDAKSILRAMDALTEPFRVHGRTSCM